MGSFSATVIISTYNQPKWLELVLIGYTVQDLLNFEIIIADDGSTEETGEMIKEFQKSTSLPIKHLWQADEGFRKNKILNKSIEVSRSDYLIFTDGDCIPKADFVSTHLRHRKRGYFLSGGYFKLPKSVSEKINQSIIENQDCFKAEWLLKNGLVKSFKLNKLTSKGRKERLLNRFTPTKATWDGMNVSGYKDSIIKVNGYDERMVYGGEDRELGERLVNSGIKAIQIRYSAICVHLYHERSYVSQAGWDINKRIRTQTKSKKKIWTDYGIKKA